MKSISRILVMLLLLTFMLQANDIYATDMDQSCGTTQQTAAQAPFVPTSGTVRVLVFFVKFKDESFSAGGCHDDPQQGWPATLTTQPAWADEFIDDTVNPPYTSKSISDFFYQMSNGQYNFIGDVYFYLTPENQSFYDDPSRQRGWLNKEIINEFDPIIDYSNYDADNDGDVDLIIFLYRFWTDTLPEEVLRELLT